MTQPTNNPNTTGNAEPRDYRILILTDGETFEPYSSDLASAEIVTVNEAGFDELEEGSHPGQLEPDEVIHVVSVREIEKRASDGLTFTRKLIELLEVSHYKCDIDNDTSCYAVQYGDGTAAQHKDLREAQAFAGDD